MTKTPMLDSNKEVFFRSLRPILDDGFIEKLFHLLYLIREHGSKSFGDSPRNKDEYLMFVGKVHEGWKEAHRIIAGLIKEYLHDLESLEKEKKKLHQLKDKAGKSLKIKEINILKSRIRLLRRFYDSIVWSLFNNELSALRRFNFDYSVDNLSIDNIEESEEYIGFLNKDPLTIAINSDITTFVQKGDVLAHTIGGGVKIIELKSGRKGNEIIKAVKETIESPCESFFHCFLEKASEKDIKQFGRFKKQAERNLHTVNILNNDAGFDPDLEVNIRISESDIGGHEEFSHKIVNCYQKILKDKEWAIETVDECLYIGLYSNPLFGLVGFSAWMDGMGCDSKIYNILDFMSSGLIRPIPSLNLPADLIKKIITGELVLVLCLDIPKMVEVFNNKAKSSIELFPRKNYKIDRLHIDELMTYKKYLLKVKAQDYFWFVGKGILSRILFEFSSPIAILNIYDSIDYSEDMNSKK